MLLFIEGHPYELDSEVRGMKLRDILGDIFTIPRLETVKEFMYVGYCYSHVADDVVFFLPKVVLTGDVSDSQKETVFGVSPEQLIDFESRELKETFEERGEEACRNYKEFLSTLAIWIYRVLSVYKEKNDDNILQSRDTQTLGSGKKMKHNTLFDVIIAILDFNRANQDYLTFIAKNIHSGHNNIQWSKTISKTHAVVQNGTPVYLNPVNRKKIVNFDEELLVIFYSILNYVSEEHGFPYIKNLNYEPIRKNTFKSRYIVSGYGQRRLKEIKYKYFSDKALMIWDLCYAFFVRSHEIAIKKFRQDCLMAKDFDIVFETMIDELIGENNLPKELTEQKDGKIVDHLFLEKGLIETPDNNASNTYFIGDSKYYKRNEMDNVNLTVHSIYKQYTYARNIVQWNVDLFLGLNDEKYKQEGHHQLRDELTEGYNPIPNFFISAHIRDAKEGSHKLLAFDDEIITQQQQLNLNRQFENRLFDRDTLLLSHYDVNFLFIVALYGRNKRSAQDEWREKVRQQFRKEIQELVYSLYNIRKVEFDSAKDCEQFVHDNFRVMNGKAYRPFEGASYFYLAELKSDESIEQDIMKAGDNKKKTTQLASIRDLHKQVKIDSTKVEVEHRVVERIAPADPDAASPQVWLPHYPLESPALKSRTFLVGTYRSDEHLKWILEKGVYNIRLDDSRDGAQSRPFLRSNFPHFVILYKARTGYQQIYRVFKLRRDETLHEWDEEKMRKNGYPGTPHGKYAVYFIDEEVAINHIDLWKLLTKQRIDQKIEHSPIFITGNDLLSFRITVDKI